eukprot:GHVN01087426.1.p1 GENE.GHVN01087426.1~~GHVN01087426.1.p1  ORF type:complete len:172 (+),score=21.73 GHVN01087426.1:425-940(+)
MSVMSEMRCGGAAAECSEAKMSWWGRRPKAPLKSYHTICAVRPILFAWRTTSRAMKACSLQPFTGRKPFCSFERYSWTRWDWACLVGSRLEDVVNRFALVLPQRRLEPLLGFLLTLLGQLCSEACLVFGAGCRKLGLESCVGVCVGGVVGRACVWVCVLKVSWVRWGAWKS